MPVHLDWEIDDAEIPLPDADPAPSRRTRGRGRRWRLILLIALALMAGLGYFALKVRQKHNEVEDELRALVDVELSALINGDRDLFLGRQDPSDRRWRRAQEEFFDLRYRQTMLTPWEDRPLVKEYTGEIPLVHVQGDKGWAWVQVTQGERTWREIWFYRWTRTDDWRHVRIDEEWLGEQRSLVTQHFNFTFYDRDAAVVTALAHEMEHWYDDVASLFGTRPTSRTLLTIKFDRREPTPALSFESRWEESGFILQGPSFHQSALTDDGRPTSEVRHQLAKYLVEALIAQRSDLTAHERVGPTTDALRRELRDWAVVQIRKDLSDATDWDVFPTPLVDALVARDGVQIIPALVASLQELQSLNQILAAAGTDALDPTSEMALYLAGVGRAFYDLDQQGYQSLLDPQSNPDWQNYYLGQLRDRREAVQTGLRWPVPTSLKIKSLVFNGPMAWIIAETTQSDGVTLRQAHFFHQVDTGWLLISPDPAFSGALRELRTVNLVFRYFERDATWFEGQLPLELQAIFSQAAADLGITINGVTFVIETVLQPGIDGRYWDVDNRVEFTSPIIAGWPLDHSEDQVMRIAVPLIARLFENRMENVSEEDYHVLMAHIASFWWELDRLFPERFDLGSWLGLDVHHAPGVSLTDLWQGLDENPNDEDFIRLWVSYRALFGFLSETYGHEVVPALLENVQRTEELDEWLRLSTGDGVEQIEPAWQAWVLSRYRD